MTDPAAQATLDELATAVAAVNTLVDGLFADRAAAIAERNAANAQASVLAVQLDAARATIVDLRAQLARYFPRRPGIPTAGDITRAPWDAAYTAMKAGKPNATGDKDAAKRATRTTYLDTGYVTCTVPATITATEEGFEEDMVAAYAQALEFARTGDPTWKARAVATLDAWVPLQTIATNTARDDILHRAKPIIAGCRAYVLLGLDSHPILDTFQRIAGGPGWPLLDWAQGPNWLAICALARIALAVAIGDRALFDQACGYWRQIAPYVIYLASDGTPTARPAMNLTGHFYGPLSGLTDGMPAEYRRLNKDGTQDTAHVNMGLDPLIEAAGWARAQGVDLVAEQLERLCKGVEFVAVRNALPIQSGAKKVAAGDWGHQLAYETALQVLGAAAVPSSAQAARAWRPSRRQSIWAFQTLTATVV